MSSTVENTNSIDTMGTENGANKTSRSIKFWFLVTGIMFFFGCHNYMQELIMSLPGFKVIMFTR